MPGTSVCRRRVRGNNKTGIQREQLSDILDLRLMQFPRFCAKRFVAPKRSSSCVPAR